MAEPLPGVESVSHLKPAANGRAWRRLFLHFRKVTAAEASKLTRYMDLVVQVDPLAIDDGGFLAAVRCKRKQLLSTDRGDGLSRREDEVVGFLLNGNFNYHSDIEDLLVRVKREMKRRDRVIAVIYNPLLKWGYELAKVTGLRKGEVPTTFLTKTDVLNLAQLAGFQVTAIKDAAVIPFHWLGLGDFLNRFLPSVPIVRRLSMASVVVFRPLIVTEERPRLSIVIPARNERGNIENALRRLTDFPAPIEIIFVEGHSSDGTWEEILRLADVYRDRMVIQCLRQKGKGKADAVRAGFEVAEGDLFTILDADLTMPPESLSRFYDAYMNGHADFINGSRLVYPMEGEAMRFLNRLGNVFFSKALSYVLGTQLGDTLCGTKLFSRLDYLRMVRWRHDFGDFDPFGDFELIFPAAIMGLGIIDIPVRYRARSYGTTNISRFRHGFILLKMTLVGLFRIKLGRVDLNPS